LPAGAPGIGHDPDDSDVHYVNGLPVMACLYGLDIVAQRKWKRAPDLVVSGPNEGNNAGLVNNSSGTFANLLYAINRGLPALAISHAVGRQVKWQADLPAAHAAGGEPLPNGARVPRDTDPDLENNVLDLRTAITVSPVEGVPEARPALAAAVRAQLGAFLRPAEAAR
jgi:broad specificity polyphosphatase/5'/3'-nucleotidase SurE